MCPYVENSGSAIIEFSGEARRYLDIAGCDVMLDVILDASWENVIKEISSLKPHLAMAHAVTVHYLTKDLLSAQRACI
jgi:hypothetical protein